MRTIQVPIDKPHAGQQRVIDGAARFNVLECGRRFGKTKLGMFLNVRMALKGHPVAWFAPTYKYLPEVWRETVRTLKPLSPKISVQERRIELPTGGVWDFWSLDDSDAGRGRKYKRVVIDEAGIVRELNAAWNEAIRPTLADLQGDAWFLGTPKGRNYFHRLFTRGEAGADPEWKSWRLPTTANPYIKPAEIEAARRGTLPSVFDQEYLGIPADDGGNPFGLDAIRRNTRTELADGPVAAWGIDLAKSQDYTAAVGLNGAGETCALERWQADWAQTRRRLLDMIGDTPALIDSTGVGDPIVEDMQRERYTIQGFKFTRPSKQQLMEGLAAAFQRNEVAVPEGWLVNELESFEFEYTPGGVRYSAPSDTHDDGVCALALAVKMRGDAAGMRLDVDTEGVLLVG